MEANDLIEINGKHYLLTQKANYKGANYFVAVEIVDGKMIHKYGTFREDIAKDGTVYMNLVEDPNILTEVYKLFIEDLYKDIENDPNYLEPGRIVTMGDDRDYVLLDYIPYLQDIYSVFITIDAPINMIVAKRNANNKLVDMSDTQEGVDVLRIYGLVHSGAVDINKLNSDKQ